jgi:release factor glutamine methyltransferase
METTVLNLEEKWLLEEKHNGIADDMFERDKARLRAGEPIGYVIGFVKFLGCYIDLNYRPFIPEPETEYWVEQVISFIKAGRGGRRDDREIRCLDMFAGSGCIGIAILKYILNTVVDFADIDEAAVKQININIKKNRIDERRMRIFQSDMFESINGTYDYVFANPPYVAESKLERVEQSVLDFEPRRAILGGSDGLNLIRKFLSDVLIYLKPGGIVVMEHDDVQKKKLEKWFRHHKYFEVAFRRDQFGCWRWLIARKSSR